MHKERKEAERLKETGKMGDLAEEKSRRRRDST
jgi:hypothetical protein